MIQEHLELTPVKVYGSRGLIGFYGDVYDPTNKPVGRVAALTLEEPLDLYTCDTAPPIMMTKGATQKMFQDLWNLGFRPSSGEGNVGQLGATEKHLADMRKLAASCLGVEL